MKKKNRRDFLKGSGLSLFGLSTGGLEFFITNFINGLTTKAYAQSLSELPRINISIRAPGAPVRWMFDQFLNPNGESLVPNRVVATRLTLENGRLVEPVYETSLIKGVYAPTMWTNQMPRAGSGVRPMADLLDNMLVLRGINAIDFGHLGAQRSQFLMAGQSYSLQGAISDASSVSSLPTISLKPQVGGPAYSLPFKSLKGKQPINLSTNVTLSQVLSPFVDNNTQARTLASLVPTEINSAIAALSEQKSDYNDTLRQSIKGTDELLRSGLSGLDTAWADLVTKYTDLVERSFRGGLSYTGINTNPAGVVASGRGMDHVTGSSQVATLNDMRDTIGPNSDLPKMAEHFAITEYLITRGFTDSIVLGIPNPTGLRHQQSDLNDLVTHVHDQHFTGAVSNLIVSTYMFTAFSACLMELIDTLKASTRSNGENLFDETVIQFGGEFNRYPKQTMTAGVPVSGTEHSPTSASFTHWSGAFNNDPLIVGNVIDRITASRLHGTDKDGSWGEAAKIPLLGGQQALNGNVVSTLSNFLRIKSPTPNNIPLAALTPNGVISIIGDAKTEPWESQ